MGNFDALLQILPLQWQLFLLQEEREIRTPLRILVSGASGFIGKPLVQFLRIQGYEVVSLVRKEEAGPGEIGWNPEKGMVIRSQFEGFDAVINLAGESLFSLRWTKSKRRNVLISRERTAFLLSKVLAHALSPPKVFISASALGYYGDKGEETVDEETPAGKGFLPQVCARWEGACAMIGRRGSRVIHPRFGIVLGQGGGALKAMLLPYRLGLGGAFGDGMQWVSWIALEDAISSIHFALTNSTFEGPYVAASPNPVRQIQFAEELGHLLRRPAALHWPKWLLRLLFGQMADEMLLQSVKASPKKLLDAGFHFAKPSLDTALRAAL